MNYNNVQIINDATIWVDDKQSWSKKVWIDALDNNRVYWVKMPKLDYKKKYNVEIWKDGVKMFWARMSPKANYEQIQWLYVG